MCGFVGVLGPIATDAEVIRRMAVTLHHRGPDDCGEWLDPQTGVALAHQRLSIVDLSPEGRQPMLSPSGRYVIAFNGEIYNHQSIRQQLLPLGCSFRGHSDTEVLLNAIEQWGIEPALNRSAGMFAFALFDRKQRMMTLARDRMGEKPLYYGWQGDGNQRVFLFGSELKALRQHPSWQGGVDRDALAQLLRYNYIPAPETIHPGIHKLMPGGMLRLAMSCECGWNEVDSTSWWSFEDTVTHARQNPFQGDVNEAEDELDRRLRQVVGEQLMADVPVGAFLSSGIDSASVVAMMRAVSDAPVESFTIGFDNPLFDESDDAREIARHLGTNHHQWIVSPDDAMQVIPELPTIYDEPFADASQIPTTLVSRFARQQVTVSLSGDGGDELFGGYNRHFWAPSILNRMERVPFAMRRGIATGMRGISPNGWDRGFSAVDDLLPERFRVRQPGEKIHKMARLLDAADDRQLYERLVRMWDDPVPVHGGESLDIVGRNLGLWNLNATFSERMMWQDSVTYLPDDILVKVDRAAMSTSLESRVPMLDHRIAEFALSLPLQMKIENGVGKQLLRRVLYRYVPRELMEKPKSGFGLPVHEWLRGPLWNWAEELLDERRLREEGYFDAKRVRAVWQQHLSGERNNQYLLWGVLMFQGWQMRHSEV